MVSTRSRASVKEKANGKISIEEKREMARAILVKPEITIREFGRKFDYAEPKSEEGSNGAARRMLAKVSQELVELGKLPEMKELTKLDLHLIEEGLKEQLRRIVEDPGSVSYTEISIAVHNAFKRVQLLSGGKTENIGLDLISPKEMSEEELDKVLNDFTILVKDK